MDEHDVTLSKWRAVIAACAEVHQTYKKWLVQFASWDDDFPLWSRNLGDHKAAPDLYDCESELVAAARKFKAAARATSDSWLRLPAASTLCNSILHATPNIGMTPSKLRDAGHALWEEAMDWIERAEAETLAHPSDGTPPRRTWKRLSWLPDAKAFLSRYTQKHGGMPTATAVADHVKKSVSTITTSAWWKGLADISKQVDIGTALQSGLHVRGRPKS